MRQVRFPWRVRRNLVLKSKAISLKNVAHFKEVCYIIYMQDLLKNKKLIIFDLDGTLIDSLGVWNEIDAKVVDMIRGDGLTTKDNMYEIRSDALKIFGASENPYVDYCYFLKETPD